MDSSNEFFDDPDVQFELEFLCSISLKFKIIGSSENTINKITSLEVY